MQDELVAVRPQAHWRQGAGAARPFPARLDLSAQWAESADMAALLADAAALERRLGARRAGVGGEAALLLQGAVHAARAAEGADAAHNMEVARESLRQARALHLQELQARNRITYLLGLVVGVMFVVVLPLKLLWMLSVVSQTLQSSHGHVAQATQSTLAWFAEALPLTTTVPLFLFAGLGACASVLSRLTTIDLTGESSRVMVLLSAAIRPALAVIFTCVVSVILKHKIVSVGTEDVSSALIWVAAFLCGYSERFATDMLERVPLAGGAGGAPAAAAPAAPATTADGTDQAAAGKA